MNEIDRRFLHWVENAIGTYEDTPDDLKNGYISIPFSMLTDLNEMVYQLQKEIAIKEEDCYNKRDEIDNHKEKFNEELQQWKELFYLLKKDHDLLENFQTNEWMVKARKMGVEN